MSLLTINDEFFSTMLEKASHHERRRDWFDMRNTPNDNSQRTIVAVLPTEGPDRICRHEDTSESFILLKGRIDVMLYEQLSDGSFKETERVHLSYASGNLGVQVPKGVWHTIEVFEDSVFFESKDGPYIPGK